MSAAAPTRSQPLRAWRPAQLQQVATQLDAAASTWCREWGLPLRAGDPVACTAAGHADATQDWKTLGAHGEGTAWALLTPSFRGGVAQALFGMAAPASPVAMEVLAACEEDLLARVAASLRLLPAAHASLRRPAAYERWSGRVFAQLHPGATVLIDAEVVQQLLPARADAARTAGPLVPLAEALSPARVALQVRLDGCELEFGTLQDLQLGDVLRIGHRLDAPAAVLDAAGQTVFHGFLARSGGMKAVELAASP